LSETGDSREEKSARVRGPIVIARHGKPALDRNTGPKLSWQEYVDWWARYEAGGLLQGQDAPDKLTDMVADAAVYVASPRKRAAETAALAAPEADFTYDPLFMEAPLPPPRFRRARYLPKTWNVLARAAWLWGHTFDGAESVTEARRRAQLGAEKLHELSTQGKVFLAGHGWFNRMMRPELKRLGWRCVADGGDKYWSFRVYEFRG